MPRFYRFPRLTLSLLGLSLGLVEGALYLGAPPSPTETSRKCSHAISIKNEEVKHLQQQKKADKNEPPSTFVTCTLLSSQQESAEVKRLRLGCPRQILGNSEDASLSCWEAFVRQVGSPIAHSFPLLDPTPSPVCFKTSLREEGDVLELLVRRRKESPLSLYLHCLREGERVEVWRTRKRFPSPVAFNPGVGSPPLEQKKPVRVSRVYLLEDGEAMLHIAATLKEGLEPPPHGASSSYGEKGWTQVIYAADSAQDILLLKEFQGVFQNNENQLYLTLASPQWKWQGGYGPVNPSLLAHLLTWTIPSPQEAVEGPWLRQIFLVGGKSFCTQMSDTLRNILGWENESQVKVFTGKP